MVLQPVAAQLVGQREQEVVMIVVMRAEQRRRLAHQRAMRLQLLRRHLQVFRRVRDDVQMHRRAARRREVDALEILPRVDRRVDQRIERYRLEGGGVARGR